MHHNVTPQALKSFDSPEGQTIRTFGTPTAPLFAATDVCEAIGIKNSRDALASLQDDEKMTVGLTDSHSGQRGGAQYLTLITEPGLYTLILRCRAAVKPGTPAFKFRRWITHEVIPAIRRHGEYRANLDREAAELRNRLKVVQAAMVGVFEDLHYVRGMTHHSAAQVLASTFAGAAATALSFPRATSLS
jgi:prophage antirepressor-like protein